jgi:hypothetical protein
LAFIHRDVELRVFPEECRGGETGNSAADDGDVKSAWSGIVAVEVHDYQDRVGHTVVRRIAILAAG